MTGCAGLLARRDWPRMLVPGWLLALGYGGTAVANRLLVDLDDGQVAVANWPEGGLPEEVSRQPLVWPLEAAAQEDLRWYLEDYLRAPFGVWEERGPKIQAELADWGEAVFTSVFGSGPARDAYQRARDHGLELVFRSPDPGLLGRPWELMRDSAGPVALNLGGVSRALRTANQIQTAQVPGGRLRVLMVISRPAGTGDIGYQMIARPLLHRLDAVRGQVELVVLRPPTLQALQAALAEAAEAGRPFQVVHFDGHGALPGRPVGGGGGAGRRPEMMTGPAAEGVLAFEKPGGGSDPVTASQLATVLKDARVPVVVLNACQSGAVGKDLEAAVATRLLREGCAAVVAMAYSVYAVAAAEFMAVFYERLFSGNTLTAAVTAGRRQLFQRDERPSPKGDLPLADWLVPVHYLRREVAFPQARTSRPAQEPSLEALLDDLRSPTQKQESGVGALDPVGEFVGRDDLFYELDAAARLQKVVVLYGPGGTGKTEVAKAFGRWWRDTGGTDQPEWVLWHSFEPGVASFGLDGLITQIGLAVFGSDFARLPEGERQQVVERLLAERRLLLIWDNFETVASMPDPNGATAPLEEAGRAAIKAFLARLAPHGRSAVIITSRATEDWLGPVRRIPVGGLARDEAAHYAGDLLAPYRAAAERRGRRAFGELLEWLDGHPLSMRLILPRLDTAEPETLLDELRGITPLPGGENGGDRATSLAASITYSYAHLTEQTWRLLPVVSLFHSVADEDVLAAFSTVEGVPARFAGVSKRQWTVVLEDAARTGLLTRLGWGMYQIHPALPSYLAAGWRAENPAGYKGERQACERALCAACGAFGRWLAQQIAVGGGAARTIAIIGLQRRTLGAMLGHALESHAWDEAMGIVGALDPYWETRGLGEEAAAWADRILAAKTVPGRNTPAADASAIDLWLHITLRQADWKKNAGQWNQAEQSYRQTLAYLQDQPETLSTRIFLCVVFHQLGMITQDRGRLDEADDWYRKSLTIEEDLGNRHGVATSYHQLGITARLRGRLDEADDWCRKALTIREELGDRRGMASTYHELGIIAKDRGRLDEADNWYRKTLTIQGALGDRPRLASIYHDLGNLAWTRRWLDEADDWYRKALTIQGALSDRLGMATTYHQLGINAQERGRLDEADDWHHKAHAIAEELGDRPRLAGTYHEFGLIARDRGRLDEADNWHHKAHAIQEDLGDRPGMARTYAPLGNIARDRGRLDEAGDWYRKALTIQEDLGDRLGMGTTYHQLGTVAYLRGRLDEAGDWYRKALTIQEDLGDRLGMATTYGQLGLLAEDRGQPRQALDWIVRCVSLFEQFPHPATDPAPYHLARLTAQLGIQALEASWLKVTGRPLPQAVREYVSSSGPAAG